MKISNGTKELRKLNKDQTIVFIKSFSYRSIAKTFCVSESTARRIIDAKIKQFGIVMPNTESHFIPSRFDFLISEEDCASVSSNKKQIITKDGMLVFKGNAPIHKMRNELSVVVKEYACTMLDNNQPLKFINQ